MSNALITKITFSEDDVVCGRGKGFDLFAGNQQFRRIIKENAEAYSGQKMSRSKKSHLIQQIFDQIGTHDMRFMKRSKDGEWKILDEIEIKLKIGHALRDVISLRGKSEKRKLHRVEMKAKIKQGMQDDLDSAVGTGNNIGESMQDFTRISSTAASSTASRSSGGFDCTSHISQELRRFEELDGNSEDFEPLPLGAPTALGYIENLNLAVSEPVRRSTRLSNDLVSVLRADMQIQEAVSSIAAAAQSGQALGIPPNNHRVTDIELLAAAVTKQGNKEYSEDTLSELFLENIDIEGEDDSSAGPDPP